MFIIQSVTIICKSYVANFEKSKSASLATISFQESLLLKGAACDKVLTPFCEKNDYEVISWR